ncbi:MAG TPA: hypothetical protein VL595_11825 [Pseudonocardia sp.]|jgi:hypothetical protein|nr:hypothetical protein [Pseudonocardia sp.]
MRYLFLAALAIPVIALTGACSGSQPSAPPAPSTTAEPPGLPAVMDDGTWEIGDDVQSGTYQSPGGNDCYWARLKHGDESPNGVIQKNLGGGAQTVEVHQKEDLQTLGCGTWKKVG